MVISWRLANFKAFSQIFNYSCRTNPTMLGFRGRLERRQDGATEPVSVAAGAGALLSVRRAQRRPAVRNLS